MKAEIQIQIDQPDNTKSSHQMVYLDDTRIHCNCSLPQLCIQSFS